MLSSLADAPMRYAFRTFSSSSSRTRRRRPEELIKLADDRAEHRAIRPPRAAAPPPPPAVSLLLRRRPQPRRSRRRRCLTTLEAAAVGHGHCESASARQQHSNCQARAAAPAPASAGGHPSRMEELAYNYRAHEASRRATSCAKLPGYRRPAALSAVDPSCPSAVGALFTASSQRSRSQLGASSEQASCPRTAPRSALTMPVSRHTSFEEARATLRPVQLFCARHDASPTGPVAVSRGGTFAASARRRPVRRRPRLAVAAVPHASAR